VRQALLLGLLVEGDKLPTVKEVVAKVAINPNTVSKAYRELVHFGLAAAKPGVGTFITRSLGQASLAEHGPLQDELRVWLARARAAGLTGPGIEAMIQNTVRESVEEEK
jgi:GntR family transcriptional regulator